MTAPIRRYFPEKERQLRRSMAIHMPSHNVLDFRMPPGTTDSSNKFRDLLAAVEDGASIMFPNGMWTFSDATGITLDRPILFQISAGTILRFTGDSFLFVNGDSVTIRGWGWGSIIDFSGTTVQGITIGDGITNPVDVSIEYLQLLGSGAAASAAIIPVDCSRCTFNHLLINDWEFGFDNSGVGAISQSLCAHNTFVSTTAAARLEMTDCRFTDNTDIGGSAAVSEVTGSNRNIFAGNKFATNPSLLGDSTICREHANAGTTTFSDTTANNQTAWDAIGVTPQIEIIRVTRSAGTGNLNFDKILTGSGGVIAPKGRRITVVVRNNDAVGGAGETVTVRDTASSGIGTGGFELNQRFGNQVVLPGGEEWYFSFVVNELQTKWVEVGRARMINTGVQAEYIFQDTYLINDGGAKQTLVSNTGTGAVTITPDLTLSNIFRYVLTGNITLAVPTQPASASGQSAVVTIILKQEPTTPRTVTFAAGWHFPGGGDPTVTATTNAVDVVGAVFDPVSNVWYANIMQDVKA